MKREIQELEVQPATLVAQIETMIAEQNRIPADTLKLIFRKKQMHKNNTVSNCKKNTGYAIVFMINDASSTITMAGTEITPHAPAHNHNQFENPPA